MWFCTNWLVDWSAISAIATMAATLVALFFGLREVFVRWRNNKDKRIYTATAILHQVQITKNRCNAIRDVLTGDVEQHRTRANELGAVITIQGQSTLSSYRADTEIFGVDLAAKYVYAISLIESINEFGQWLNTTELRTDASWSSAKEAIDYIRECANQSAYALSEVERDTKKFVPASVMTLRFGPKPHP